MIAALALTLTACVAPLYGGGPARRTRPRRIAGEHPVAVLNARVHRDTPAPARSPDDRGDEATNPEWRVALEVLLATPRASTRTPVAPPRPWDGVTAPRYSDRVERRFALTAGEREALTHNGFVVPERLQAATYTAAYRLVEQAELPVYVSADSVLHAVASTHAPFLAHAEEHTLSPVLARVLRRMHDALASSPGTLTEEAAADADLVLTVARSLLEVDEGTVPAALGAQPAIAELTGVARAGAPRAVRYLFGRPRAMDFTEYRPRGHYARAGSLGRYFQAAQWLSRVELNLVSRGCRSSHPGPAPDARETPREALAALALADLVERAGVGADLARLDQAWSLLYGRREDVSLSRVNVMRDVVRIRDLRSADTFDRFRLVARNLPRRALRTHPLPDAVTDLPLVASLFGARVRPGDNLAADLGGPSVPGRSPPDAAGVAYALGLDRARAWIDPPPEAAPDVDRALARARDAVPLTVGGNDLVSNWFRALTALAAPTGGRRPTFMNTEAFADLRLNSVLAAYGGFLPRDDARREVATTAAPSATPSVWVDPAPEVYGAVEMYAERALAVARAMFDWTADRSDAVRSRDREFVRALDDLSRVSRALRVVAEDELAGRVPSEVQVSFLASVASTPPGGPDGADASDGWYAALFPSADAALERAEFAVEWAAGPDARAWIGADAPRLGIFVIDNGGHPFTAVGPVARAWELAAPPGTTSQEALARARYSASSRWSATWLHAQAPAPPLAITALDVDGTPSRRALIVRARQDLGRVSIELLDAHGAPIAEATRLVSDRPVRFTFHRRTTGARSRHRYGPREPSPGYIDNTRVWAAPHAVRVRVGAFWYEQAAPTGQRLQVALGGMRPIDERGEELPDPPVPE